MAKNLRKNYLYSLTYQVLTLITPFVTTPYVSRVLGAEGVGIASYVTAVVFYFTLIASLGTATVGQREVAYQRDDIEKRSLAFWNTELLNLIAVCVVSLIYAVFLYCQTDTQIYYKILWLNIITVATDVVWFFQGMEEFQKIVIRNIIFKFIGITYLFMFVKTGTDVDIYLLGNTLVGLVSAISLWGYLPGYIRKVSWRSINLRKTFRQSLLLFIPTLAVSVYVVLDKIMLGWFTTDYTQNGYYEQAMKIAKMGVLPIMSLASVMTPRISYCFQRRDFSNLESYMYKSYRMLWLIGLPICFGLWGIADDFVPWFFGAEFASVVGLIYILALLVPIQGFTIISGGQYLVSVKEEKYFTYSVLGGAVINSVLNLLLIPYLFAYGAAIASVVAEICVALIQLYYVLQHLKIKKIFTPLLKYMFAALTMLLMIIIEQCLLETSIISTLINIVTGGVIYSLCLFIMHDDMFMEYSCKFRCKLW